MKQFFFGLISVIALGLAGCSDSDKPIAGEIALSDAFIWDFALTDMHGQPVTDESLQPKFVLAYFGFASCPDVCPNALSRLTVALNDLPKDKVTPVFITVDPERDTAEALRDYLSFDDRILGVTGSEADMKTLRDKMNIFAAKVEMEDSAMGYTMDHQSMFFLIDPTGKPIMALKDSMPPSTMAKSIKRQLKQYK